MTHPHHDSHPAQTTSIPSVIRWKDGLPQAPSPDHLVKEEPLEIRVKGQAVAITMRTPGHDNELAIGFLVSEGILQNPQHLIAVEPCRQASPEAEGNILNVFLTPQAPLDLERLTRHVFANSSCGLCGKASIESIQTLHPPVSSPITYPASLLPQLPLRLHQAQLAFQKTGGLHAAALFDPDGKLLFLREDVGRHNAVDKVIGASFLSSLWPPDSHLLLVSGRVSFEIMQKALAARIPIIAAISAPSDLAVHFAQENNQTLIGFLRNSTFNLYTHPERIQP